MANDCAKLLFAVVEFWYSARNNSPQPEPIMKTDKEEYPKVHIDKMGNLRLDVEHFFSLESVKAKEKLFREADIVGKIFNGHAFVSPDKPDEKSPEKS